MEDALTALSVIFYMDTKEGWMVTVQWQPKPVERKFGRENNSEKILLVINVDAEILNVFSYMWIGYGFYNHFIVRYLY